MSYYNERRSLGLTINGTPAEIVTEEIARNATRGLHRVDWEDIQQELLILVWQSSSWDNPLYDTTERKFNTEPIHRKAREILKLRAKWLVSQATRTVSHEDIKPDEVHSYVTGAYVSDLFDQAFASIRDDQQKLLIRVYRDSEDLYEVLPEISKEYARKKLQRARDAVANKARQLASKEPLDEYDFEVTSFYVEDASEKPVEATEPVEVEVIQPELDPRFWEAYKALDEADQYLISFADNPDVSERHKRKSAASIERAREKLARTLETV